MKAEIAVRSISASISACAARTAPRTISRVTGSQIGSLERSIRAVLHKEQGNKAYDCCKDLEDGRRHRISSRVDRTGGGEGRKAVAQGSLAGLTDRRHGWGTTDCKHRANRGRVGQP